ncbi:MAG: hypothetical protein AB7O32_00195 [Vicinamibacterales bacterium]
MASARIDIAVLLELVTTRLLTLASADLVVLPMGRPTPTGAGPAWCRVKKLSVPMGAPQVTDGGADQKAVQLVVECQVQADLETGSTYSIASIAEEVRAALDQQGLVDPGTTHTLVFTDSGAELEADEGDQELILRATVTFAGEAMRQSGETRAAFSPDA